MEKDNKSLYFRFDVSTFRLLGRELITDRITAIFELVKNCYDANAENVTIEFIDVNPLSDNSKIIISDNGIGMSFLDLRDKWMVIGTSNKRREDISPAPYYRKVVGKKGIGRFAIDKLGAKVIIKTKKDSDKELNCLKLDWTLYEQKERTESSPNSSEETLFTEIANHYWTEFDDSNSHGTLIEISSLSECWTYTDVVRVSKELSRIVHPERKSKFPFDIYINAPQYSDFNNKKIESFAYTKSNIHFQIDYRYDESSGTYYQTEINYRDGELTETEIPAKIFGPLSFSLYYYNNEGKKNFNKMYPDSRIDGIKVYRDGIIATPFAEYNSNRDNQKDLFGLDKRRWSGFFDKIGTRDVIGWVDISKELNPNIIDATNRQDFVANEEWNELKRFVTDQIHQLELFLKGTKSKERENQKENIHNVSNGLKDVRKTLVNIQQTIGSGEVSSAINSINQKLSSVQHALDSSSNVIQSLESEKKQQENIMFSLVSLQSYAGQMSHILKTSIGTIKRSAEYVAKYLQMDKNQDKCIFHAKRIESEMGKLSRAMDFMLSYAKDDSTFEPFNIKSILNDLFNISYKNLIESEGIHFELNVEDDFELVYNSKAFVDMFGNLLSNSIKALHNTEYKKIKCDVMRESNALRILFSDNGEGVKQDDKDRIFDEFFTTTADLGGAGLGLYIIKTRLRAINGSISLVESEFKPTGASFNIVIPLKQ